jgi:hypothetical protein
MPVRFIRIWMTESSNTCDTHGSADRRNCVGYAIRELYLGTVSADGKFHDLVRHTADPDQTATICSSVDPWHEPANVSEKRDQIGFDLFYTSGYTRGLPAMIPIALLYGTPEDSAAQIPYLKARGYPISYIEMGEEPDGQFMLPEQYGALYLQWATALHCVDPALKLGGPIFQGVNEDIQVWPDAQGKTSWLGRFIDYLKAHGRIADLAFASFEHYPLEPCKIQWSSLYNEPTLISHILQVWRDDGLPPNVPIFISELNIAWNTGESFVDISRRALAGRLRRIVSFRRRRWPLLLPLPAGRSRPRLQRLVGHIRAIYRGFELSDPAAHIPVLCQSIDQSGVGAARHRRATDLPRQQRHL